MSKKMKQNPLVITPPGAILQLFMWRKNLSASQIAKMTGRSTTFIKRFIDGQKPLDRMFAKIMVKLFCSDGECFGKFTVNQWMSCDRRYRKWRESVRLRDNQTVVGCVLRDDIPAIKGLFDNLEKSGVPYSFFTWGNLYFKAATRNHG